jgi:hypothetical protein
MVALRRTLGAQVERTRSVDATADADGGDFFSPEVQGRSLTCGPGSSTLWGHVSYVRNQRDG